MSSETGFERELRALSVQFRRSLPPAMDSLSALWQDLVTGRARPGTARELHRSLHSIVGSGSTFGVPALSHAASAAEAWIEDFAQQSAVPDAQQRAQFEQLFGCLSEVALAAAASVPPEAGSANAYREAPNIVDRTVASSTIPIEQRQVTSSTCKPRVLLAEDTKLIQMISSALLTRHGCETVVVNDGVEAVMAWTRERFSLILMDVQMPHMDGVAATAAIRQKEIGSAARVPIVGVTADERPAERERCLAAGMDDCIIKPLDSATVAQIIRRHVIAAAEHRRS